MRSSAGLAPTMRSRRRRARCARTRGPPPRSLRSVRVMPAGPAWRASFAKSRSVQLAHHQAERRGLLRRAQRRRGRDLESDRRAHLAVMPDPLHERIPEARANFVASASAASSWERSAALVGALLLERRRNTIDGSFGGAHRIKCRRTRELDRRSLAGRALEQRRARPERARHVRGVRRLPRAL